MNSLNYNTRDAANFRTEWETDEYILIKDVGPWDKFQTITNAAEWVVAQIAARLGNRKLYYIDSEGQTDQLLVHDGKFAGFVAGGPDDGQ